MHATGDDDDRLSIDEFFLLSDVEGVEGQSTYGSAEQFPLVINALVKALELELVIELVFLRHCLLKFFV